MALINTKAVVLKCTVAGESDAIVTLYTLSSGKLRAVAKGAKRSKKRFMNCLDLFGLVEVGLVERPKLDLLRVDTCRLLDRPDLTQKPLLFGLGALALELVSIFCPEKEPDEIVFLALASTLRGLVEHPRPLDLSLAFCLKLLLAAGFGPNFEACQSCGQKLDQLEQAAFDPARGGLICSACRPGGAELFKGTLKTARWCQRIDPQALKRVRFPEEQRSILFDQMTRYAVHTAGRELNSLAFLDQIKPQSQSQ